MNSINFPEDKRELMIIGIVIELVYGYLHGGFFLFTFTRISINDCPNDGGVVICCSTCDVSQMGDN
ncbi:unnamed protein product, partial [Vitis vinifera]|uniref:Uncharacterized protein n=1 Tax=Vitis vinifera TaxID=29760 RepID=D7TS88_VITVI